MDDTFITIRQPSTVETKVKGSRFIARTFVVKSVEEAMDRLGEIRKREYSATHHCYAYIVGRGADRIFKYSDAGEPTGTAGKPIYDVISGSGATDVVCVVTRYFGGTKLGTGGLVRAYSEAAKGAMDNSGLQENFLTNKYRFTLPFGLYDRWQKIMHQLGAIVDASDFSDCVSLRVSIRRAYSARLLEAFTELTSGKGEIEEIPSD